MFGRYNIAPNATPEQIARNRQIIEQMMPRGRARFAGEGLVDLASGIIGGLSARRMNRAEDENLRREQELALGPQDIVQAAVQRSNARAPQQGNVLMGGAGNDMLAGGGGADILMPQDPATLPPQMVLGPHTMGAQDALGRDYGFGGPVGPRFPDEPMPQMAPTPRMMPQGPAVPAPLPAVPAPDMPSRGEVRGMSMPADPELMGAEMDFMRHGFERQPVNGKRVMRRDPVSGGAGRDTIMGQGQETFDLPGFNTTEGQVFGYTVRAADANRILNEFEDQGARFGQRMVSQVGGIGNLLLDDDFQQYLNAEQNFLAAVLRRDTGAAITREEFDLYRPMFFPQPGDGPSVIAQKRQMRESALASMAAGTAEGFDLLPEDVRALLQGVRGDPAPTGTSQPEPTHRFNPTTGQIEAIR